MPSRAPQPPTAPAPRLDAQSVARDALAADIKKATKRLEKLKTLIEDNDIWLRKYHEEFEALTIGTQAKMRLRDSL